MSGMRPSPAFPGQRRLALRRGRRCCSQLTLAAVMFVWCPAGARAQAPTLLLTPERAVELALEHDLELKRDRLGPQIADFEVSAATTVWTPQVTGRLFGARSEAPSTSPIDQIAVLNDREVASEVAFSQRLPWGSTYRVSWDAGRLATNSVLSRYQPALRSSMGVTVEQPLLKGLTFDAARADRDITLQERELADTDLAAAIASTRREVLHAYWRWVYARDFLAVQRQSLALAQELLDGNRTRVARGAMAAVDVIEAEVEVARRGEDILVAEMNVTNAEERLRLQIFEPGDPAGKVALEPEARTGELPPVGTNGAQSALTDREDLKALRTAIAIDAIDVRRFRNEKLPDVSLLGHYSVRGTGGTELIRGGGFPGPIIGTSRRNFASVLNDLADSRYPSWSVELAVRYPIGTARAEADAARASLQRQQREAALRAAEQRVVLEVDTTVRAVETNYRRLATSATVVTLSERRLDAEEKKFASGLSTSFFVFEAQRDLSLAREAQLKSRLDYHLSTVDFEAVKVIPLDTLPASAPPPR
jgi:outer membrane protein